jgi:hypothetical protein
MEGSESSSSYYFFKSTPAEEAKKYAPMKVDGVVSDSVDTKSGASVWNSAGTWEERDHSEWAKNRIKELFKNQTIPAGESRSLRISRATLVSGHVRFWRESVL